jgi:putative peptide zinc metalloprotease protein
MITENSIVILKLSIQMDGEEYIIGDVLTETYIKVPYEAVEVINYCNGENTIKEIQSNCPDVDVMDFIITLHELNLVFQIDENQFLKEYIPKGNSKIVSVFSNIFFNTYAYVVYCFFFLASITLFLFNTRLLPQIDDFFLVDFMGVNILIIFITSWILTFFHELGHYLAASKYKVPVTFNLNLRMHWLVVEANMTNLWSISKKHRYIAFLGGIMFDCVLLFAALVLQIGIENSFFLSYLKLITLVLSFRFLWHFLVFLRTDIYYVLTNLLNISNLHQNSRLYLMQLIKKNENSEVEIPESERIPTKIFASFYLIGLGIAFLMIFGYSLPIIYSTIENAMIQFSAFQTDILLFLDGVLILLVFLLQSMIWLKGALNKIKETKTVNQ